MDQTNSFFIVSREVAKNFIQSVVAVDDRMSFESRPSDVSDVDVEELDEPDTDVLSPGVIKLTNDNIRQDISDTRNHKLYYQELSAAFAEKGIVCSGFLPLTTHDLTKRAVLLSSKNADITILDWQMDMPEETIKGTLATDTIAEILKADIQEGGRLRLITIYTAENLRSVVDSLCKSIRKNNADFKCKANKNSVFFDNELLKYCKIDVISKDKTERELSDSLIDSFALLTAGLLSNAALASITDIRNKTHNILYKFNKNLDPAYLSHVLGLISSPGMREQAHEVALDYAVDLISEEIKSELQISKIVKHSLSRDNLVLWPKHVNENNKADFFGITVGTLGVVKFGSNRMESFLAIKTQEDLQAALDETPHIAREDIEPNNPILYFEKQVVQLSAETDFTTQHYELSALECVRRDQRTIRDHVPVLKQGSILQAGTEYFVCIQPLCDSVRLTCATAFIFLKVRKASGSNFSHVVRKKDGNYLRLDVRATSKSLALFNFLPDPDYRVVKASLSNNQFEFLTSDQKIFLWCGELKQAVTQSIVNSVAAQMSRVGFDSFEWLRLKAT